MCGPGPWVAEELWGAAWGPQMSSAVEQQPVARATAPSLSGAWQLSGFVHDLGG